MSDHEGQFGVSTWPGYRPVMQSNSHGDVALRYFVDVGSTYNQKAK